MRRKIIKIFAITIFTQLCLYACCANDQYNTFITSIELSALSNNIINPSTVSNTDFNLLIATSFESELVSYISKQSGFINTANAVTCIDDYIVINPVTSINVEANVPLFDIPAGESLNNNILLNYTFNSDDIISFDNLIEILNNERDITSISYIKFDTEIPTNTTVRFKITYTLENGEQLESTSTEVTFE